MKTIFFDLDDTLLWDKQSIQQAFDQTCQSVPELDAKELEKNVRKAATDCYQTYDFYEFIKIIGINPFEGLWGTFNDSGEMFQKMFQQIEDYQNQSWIHGLQLCGIDNPTLGKTLAKKFIEERKKAPLTYEETFYVLDQLKENYQLALITNGSPSLQQCKLTLTPELVPYFSHIFISGDFGKGKPDPAIFHHALEQTHTKAKDAIMIGDNLNTDILGSNQAGILNIWINHHQQEASAIIPNYTVSRLQEILPIIKQLS